jgi:hypothetical protein
MRDMSEAIAELLSTLRTHLRQIHDVAIQVLPQGDHDSGTSAYRPFTSLLAEYDRYVIVISSQYRIINCLSRYLNELLHRLEAIGKHHQLWQQSRRSEDLTLIQHQVAEARNNFQVSSCLIYPPR